MLVTAQNHGFAVRVPDGQRHHVLRALEAGAAIVVVPMINTPEEASRAVAACRYPPEGRRSWGPIRHALAVEGFTPQTGNRLAACAVMIETREAVAKIDAILEVPGIDAVYLGPMDLSVSYGLDPGGLLKSAEGEQIFRSIVAACERHGVVPGTHCPDLDAAHRFRDLGFRMLNVSGDARFLRQGAAEVVAALGQGTPDASAGGGYT